MPDAVIAVCGHHVSVRPDDFNYPARRSTGSSPARRRRRSLTLAAPGRSRGARDGRAVTRSRARRCRWTPRTCPTTRRTRTPPRGRPSSASSSAAAARTTRRPACCARAAGAGTRTRPDRRGGRSTWWPPFAPAGCWCSTPRSATSRAGGVPCSTCSRLAIAATSRSASPVAPTPCSAWTPTSSPRRAPASCSSSARSPRRCSAAPARRRTRRRPSAHALELLEYASAKGVVTRARFEFNQPGETEESAARDARRARALRAGRAQHVGDHRRPAVGVPAGQRRRGRRRRPGSRFGTRIKHPEWWKERVDAHTAATAVVASHELAPQAPATTRTGARGSRSCGTRWPPSSPPTRAGA